MREILIARILELVSSEFGITRWRPVKESLYKTIYQGDPDTKRGKKECLALDVKTVDFTILTDEQLVVLFELTVRRWSMQM